MAQTTARERAANAAEHRRQHARRRRFAAAAGEMSEHPECLDPIAQARIAEALARCGWHVLRA
jgi:hypothetical protein